MGIKNKNSWRLKYLVSFIFLLSNYIIFGQDLPQVSIVQPLNGSVYENDKIKVDYVVSGKALNFVKILINDKPVNLLNDVKIGQNTVMVDVKENNCRISIVAVNDFGASVPAAVNLTRKENILMPKLYILAIGISNYSNPELKLKFAAKDAKDFSQVMLAQDKLLYEKVELKLLIDEEATADNIREGLYWLQTETTARDVAMLFMAGHGVNNNIGNFFFMPVHADINRINVTCVGYSDIQATLDAIAGKIVFFVDACHSGNVLGNYQRRANLNYQAISELSNAENGAIVFTSSTRNQYSLENIDWNNGAFTKALVEGLNGKADLFDRKTIYVKNLDSYVANRVKVLTNGQQAPTTIIPSSVQDFPLAVVIDNLDDPKILGDNYFYGYGEQRDCREAEKWYRKSAEQGNAYAQNKLGEMYSVYNQYICHIKTDYDEALKWFKLSAEQGFADAQFNMGVMYQYGYGVSMNLESAVRWYRLSAAQGNKAAKAIVEGVGN